MSMMLHSTSSAPALAFAVSIMAGLMSLAFMAFRGMAA